VPAREPAPGRRLADWLLLEANRWALTGAILLAVFASLVALSRAGLTPLRVIVETTGSVEFVFAAFIGTIVTGTAIVVTINQLVLAQELGALGDQHERMQNAMAFHREVEAATGMEATPAEPAAFLLALVDAIDERADALEAAVEGADGAGEADDVSAYADSLAADARAARERLAGAEFGTFDVIWGALAFEYAEKIATGRQLRAASGDALPSETADALAETVELLTLFGPVREHLKTLYFQWELIDLSRALLYVSVPALATMGALLMYVDESALPGTLLGVDHLVWLVAGGFVVGVSPFVVFTVFVLRIATVAKRTLAIGPFVLQRRDDGG